MKTDKANMLIEAFNPYAWMNKPETLIEKVTSKSSGNAIEKALGNIEDRTNDNDADLRKLRIANGDGELTTAGMNSVKRIVKEALKDIEDLEQIRKTAGERAKIDKKSDSFSSSQIDVLTDIAGQYGRNIANQLTRIAKQAAKIIGKHPLKESGNYDHGDVWKLETSEEDYAAEELNELIEYALAGDKPAIAKVDEVFKHEKLSSIEKKWKTEGSTWYVWWMDAVRRLIQLDS